MIKKRGLTLIELLITMGLIGSILIVITSLYLSGYRTFSEELASSTVQSNAQTILDAVVTDIKNGMLIEPTYNTYTTGANTIIIRVPSVDANQHIIYSNGEGGGEDEGENEGENSDENTPNMLYDRLIYYYENNEIHKVTFANHASIRYKNDGKDSTLDKKALALSFTYDPDQTTATLVKVNLQSDIRVGNRNKEININGEARLRNHI